MPTSKDPSEVINKAASAFPNVSSGTSCNQTAYKTGKKAFLYIGPGPKGVGYKAMFKLDASMAEAQEMARNDPERFEIGVGNWVTTRFTAENPLPKKIWSRWLKESYAGAGGNASAGK